MKMQSLSSASFTGYSPSDNLSQIAARVIDEFQSNDDFMLEYTDYDDDKKFVTNNNNNQQQQQDEDKDEEDEGEFEFPQAPISPIPADEIFSNGQIRPVYPLFNTELVFGNVPFPNTNSVMSTTIPKASARLPLRKLFMEERENCALSSCSSSESDELDGVPNETYCVWRPNTGDNPRELRKKSSSTGTNSKRWKFRGLLHKSNSDGNDTFDFLNMKKELEAAGKETTAPQKKGPVKENDVRRSYLPHKKDLVELFFSVNGVSRHVNPY